MNFFTRRLLAVGFGLTVGVTTVGMAAAPVGAAVPYPAISVVTVTNNTAPNVVFTPGQATCTLTSVEVYNPLYDPDAGYFPEYFENLYEAAVVDSPWIYAKNRTAAVDVGYVASRARLLDRSTNQIVYGGWSPWTLAADNKPFHAASTRFTNLNLSHGYVAQEEMLWYNPNGTTTRVVVQLQQYRRLIIRTDRYGYTALLSNTIESRCF